MANRIYGVGPLKPAPAYSCHSLYDGMNFRLRGGIQIPPYLPYPIFYLLRISAHPGGPISPAKRGGI